MLRRLRRMNKTLAVTLSVAVVSLAACQRPAVEEVAAVKSRVALVAPVGPACKGEAGGVLWEDTRALYEQRQFEPAWIVNGKARPSADDLLELLAASGDDGLDPQQYAVDDLRRRVKAVRDQEAGADLEIELSCALMRYASHLAFGHPVAKEIDANWTVTPRTLDVTGLVASSIAGNTLGALPAKLAPAHPEYARLKEMLQRYRKIAGEGKLQPVPEDLAMKAGPASAGLVALRSNLLILGDLQDTARSDDNVFNEDLSKADDAFRERNAAQPEKTPDAKKIAVVDTLDGNLGEAVRRFEARHGLNPDGVPDAAMIAAMNVPAQDRVRQIETNLERWRWMPADFGSPHILVNIPAYRMQVRDDEEAVPLKMRVIVGKETNRTPIFSDSMTEIVFSPYWNIPQSIETKEMLPEMAKDSDYLNKKNIEVVRMSNGKAQVVKTSSIDWANAKDAGDFRLRQKPGAKNALGFVKFMFPNRHSVYLHDTPTDNLFDKLTRDFSHGCVRLEEPVKLAAYVLRDQPEWTAERIETAMHAGKEQHVALKHPVAVHLLYLTARVDDDGVPQFFEDIYGYDGKQRELTRPATQPVL